MIATTVSMFVVAACIGVGALVFAVLFLRHEWHVWKRLNETLPTTHTSTRG